MSNLVSCSLTRFTENRIGIGIARDRVILAVIFCLVAQLEGLVLVINPFLKREGIAFLGRAESGDLWRD
jgi:uncharacterized protein YjeT (DUF2065 family)